MAFRVLLDACVLIPYDLCDTLPTLAEDDLFQPLWSTSVLEETERNLVRRLGRTPEQAQRRIRLMNQAFPEAMVEGYADLVHIALGESHCSGVG